MENYDELDKDPIVRDDPRSDTRNLVKTETENDEFLTVKQMMFVNQLFTMDNMMNPKSAAAAAGYDPDYGRTLMLRPAVRLEVEKRLSRMKHSSACTPDAVRDKMWEEANNHDPDDSSPTARVTALKTLMQMHNLIGPKDRGGDVRPSVNISINLGGKDDSHIIIDGEKHAVQSELQSVKDSSELPPE